MTDRRSSSQAAAVEDEAAGQGGLSQAELDELVASSDTGGRSRRAARCGMFLMLVALAWSLFQLWIASPMPFMVRFGVFNDTEARSIHLGLRAVPRLRRLSRRTHEVPAGPRHRRAGPADALFFMIAAKDGTPTWWIPIVGIAVVAAILLGSPKDRVPAWEWALAIVGAATALYLYVFYGGIVRPGRRADHAGLSSSPSSASSILLEATRRALGPALMIVASVFLAYTFLGPYMPGHHRPQGQQSLGEMVNHQWITTEGVFGIALGVSTTFVFLFVLFGSLLDKAGAGNYFIQVAFSLMGHMRGGPAKAAVVSSAMTGLISGSSIANVVTTGTFTIPLMKKVGFSSEKAGAVEVASSVNGQIMPPVMGAAAFLMVEYVGIPYFDVVKHAFLPAVISYIALVYIVHLEALKAGMEGLPRAYTAQAHRAAPDRHRLHHRGDLRAVASPSTTAWAGSGPPSRTRRPTSSSSLLTAVYVALLWVAGREAPLKMDDPDAPVTKLPLPGPTVRVGPALHPAGRGAGLGADGRPPLARPLGLLGGGLHDLHPADPAPADGDVPRRQAVRRPTIRKAASST